MFHTQDVTWKVQNAFKVLHQGLESLRVKEALLDGRSSGHTFLKTLRAASEHKTVVPELRCIC